MQNEIHHTYWSNNGIYIHKSLFNYYIRNENFKIRTKGLSTYVHIDFYIRMSILRESTCVDTC